MYKHPTETRVATWNEVADLLEQDSLTAEAQEIREITENTRTPMRNLPPYHAYPTTPLPSKNDCPNSAQCSMNTNMKSSAN